MTAQSNVTTTAVAAPGWAQRMRRFNDWALHDVGGGPRLLKFAWVINTQKAGTFAFLGLVMALYADRSPAATSLAAWIYLALHGSYGLVWVMKDVAFPDPNWQKKITLGSSALVFGTLALYWSFGWLLISGIAQPHYPLPEKVWFCLCISVCILGCVIMIAADAQKYFTLRVRRGLITDGMFRYIRHPNYLGEMMIYGSFALLVMHWFPVLVLAMIWGGLFSINMIMKEASMSRYADWADYRRRSWWLVPFVF